MILPVDTLIKALLIISVITNLTTEGLKMLLDEMGKKYSSNILAAIIATVASIVLSIAYLAIQGIPFSASIAATIVCLIWLSFLVATVGYDKIVQALKQFIK